MKKILFLSLIFLIHGLAVSQNNVGIGTATPRPRAILELSSTDKGLLVPRTSPASVPGLVAADAGLLIFNPANGYFYYWDGTKWLTLPDRDWQINVLAPGDTAQYSIPNKVGIGVVSPTANFHVNGTIRFQNLVPTNDSIVVVTDALGNLRVHTLPGSVWDGDNQQLSMNGDTLFISGGNYVLIPSTNITAGDGLISVGPAGNQILHVQANNGLNVDAAADAVQLGGPLIENTTITNGVNNLAINLNGTGNFQVQANGAPLIHAENNAAVGGRVGIGTAALTSNFALMEMFATNKGILIPEMDDAIMYAIPVTPAEIGLMVFNTSRKVHMYWNGACWLPVGVTICTDFSVTAIPNAGCIYTTNASCQVFDIVVDTLFGAQVPVSLSAAGLPAGISGTWSSSAVIPPDTVQLTLCGSSTSVPGTYPVYVMGIFGPIVHLDTINLTVVPGSMTLSQDTGYVNEIDLISLPDTNVTSAATTLNINFPPTGNCPTTPNATISIPSIPLGVTFTLSQNPIPTNNGSCVITFTADASAIIGTYTITILVNIGGQIVSFPYTLIIEPSVVNITASTNNYNLFTAVNPIPAGSPITLTCNVYAGVNITSTSTAQPAFQTGPFISSPLEHITLVNNGNIVGLGGNGGGSTCTYPNTSGCTSAILDGKNGGPALFLQTPYVQINNAGLIGSGGGGGGGGEDLSPIPALGNNCFGGTRYGSGGGGGAGGGIGGASPCCNGGTNGTLVGPGNGGAACADNCNPCVCLPFVGCSGFNSCNQSGTGGMGGNFGMPGLDGAESSGDIDIFAFAGSCQPSALNCTDPFSPDDPIACDRGVGGQPGNAITTNNYQFTYNGIIVPANSYPLPSVLPPTPISGGQPLTGVAGPVVQ